jgi:hypothetical protein
MRIIAFFLYSTLLFADYQYKDNEVVVKHSQTILGTPYSFSSPSEPNPDCVKEIKEYDSPSYRVNKELEETLFEFEDRVKNCLDNPKLASKYKEAYSKMNHHFRGQDKLFENYITKYLPANNIQASGHIGHHWNNMIGASKTLHTFRVNGEALNDIPLHKVKKMKGTVEVLVLPCEFSAPQLEFYKKELEKLSPFVSRYWEYGSCNKYHYEIVSQGMMPNGIFKLVGSDGAVVNLAYSDPKQMKIDRTEKVTSSTFNAPKLPKLFIDRELLNQYNEKASKKPREEKTIWEIISETYFKVFYPQLIEAEVAD